MTTHIHVETAASDCDGPIYRTYVVWCPDESHDYDFWSDYVRSMVYAGAIGAKLTITEDTAEWEESTEEGYRHMTGTLCRDECEGGSTYRDVRAEEAGY